MAMSNEFSNNGSNKRPGNNKKSGKSFMDIVKSIIPMKGDKKSTIIYKSIFIVAVIALIICMVSLISYFNGNKRDREVHEDVISMYTSSSSEEPSSNGSSDVDSTSSDESSVDASSDVDSTSDSSSTNSSTTSATNSSKTDTSSGTSSSTPNTANIQANFVELVKKNSDTVGWIEIPGIKQIAYPVLQTTDNDFYMTHDFYKKSSKAGSIYADFRVPVGGSNNTVVYGHNMASGEYFAHLHDYKSLSFMKEHTIVNFNNLQENTQYKIFGVILTSVDAKDDGGVVFDFHNKVYQYSNQTEFNTFYNNIMKRSYYDTPVDVKYGDQILVLQTCGSDNHDFKNSRFVIFARRVRPGESTAVDTSKIVENTDKYMPIAWYQAHGLKSPR